MSQFKPGQSGNPGGRPPGSKNKLTKHLRASLKNILDGELQNLPALLEKLEPKDRVELTIKLMRYALPPVQSVPPSAHEPFDLDLERI